ncbi:hypothetical protein K439DRAFT_1660893 [Ramaria rubella]|nr:hypothetical protein K439DRAFT_1660893 [Ramaria rubella]
MSQYSSLELDERWQYVNVYTPVTFSALVVFFYDYILCTYREINMIWRRKLNLTSGLYVMIRYLPLFGLVYNVAVAFSRRSICAQALINLASIMSLLAHVASIVLLVLQTCDMCSGRVLIVGSLGVLGLGQVVLGILQATKTTCTTASNPSSDVKVDAFAAIVLIVFSMMMGCFSLYKMCNCIYLRDSLLCENVLSGSTFTQCLYMLGISGLWIFSAIQAVNSGKQAPNPTAYVTPLLPPLSSIIMTHYILHLREDTCSWIYDSQETDMLPVKLPSFHSTKLTRLALTLKITNSKYNRAASLIHHRPTLDSKRTHGGTEDQVNNGWVTPQRWGKWQQRSEEIPHDPVSAHESVSPEADSPLWGCQGDVNNI